MFFSSLIDQPSYITNPSPNKNFLQRSVWDGWTVRLTNLQA